MPILHCCIARNYSSRANSCAKEALFLRTRCVGSYSVSAGGSRTRRVDFRVPRGSGKGRTPPCTLCATVSSSVQFAQPLWLCCDKVRPQSCLWERVDHLVNSAPLSVAASTSALVQLHMSPLRIHTRALTLCTVFIPVFWQFSFASVIIHSLHVPFNYCLQWP